MRRQKSGVRRTGEKKCVSAKECSVRREETGVRSSKSKLYKFDLEIKGYSGLELGILLGFGEFGAGRIKKPCVGLGGIVYFRGLLCRTG